MQLNTADHLSVNGTSRISRRAAGRQPADSGTTDASPESAAPETPHPKDRDEHGRFVKGNSGGPGNPFARRTAALRQAFSEAISEDDLKTLAKRLLVQAQNGDVAAAKLVLAYAIGKPVDPVNPDTLDIEELQLFNQFPLSAPDFQRIINNVPVGFTCQLLRILVQNAEHQAKLRMAEKFDQDTKKEERRQKRRAARAARKAAASADGSAAGCATSSPTHPTQDPPSLNHSFEPAAPATARPNRPSNRPSQNGPNGQSNDDSPEPAAPARARPNRPSNRPSQNGPNGSKAIGDSGAVEHSRPPDAPKPPAPHPRRTRRPASDREILQKLKSGESCEGVC
jgi:hypothetical protein